MKKLYCNGKKGFCPHYNGKDLPNCGSDIKCKHFDDTGSEVIEDVFTNYDRIRNMSVDELAEFIPDWSYTKACKCDELPFVDCDNVCKKCVKEWLESEVESDA